MEELDKISIIVPIYNVEQYVENCIRSIAAQTYRNLEIILVDDGSTDRSGEICDAYAEQDDRIKVFHVENGGQSRARNIGLEHAEGTLIGFVDGDDAVTHRMYEILWRDLQEQKAGIAECNFTGRKSREPDDMEAGSLQILTGREALIRQLDRRRVSRFPSTSVWSKLFRREVIGELRFPEGRIHEEYSFLCQTIYRCENYVYRNEPLYTRTLRGDSTTAAAFSVRTLDKLLVYRDRDEFLQQAGEEELLALSKVQRYDLMLHYYNCCVDSGMKEQAADIRGQLALEWKAIRRSTLEKKRKSLIFLLIYGKIVYQWAWKLGRKR